MEQKQYGLIRLSKQTNKHTLTTIKPSIFGSDSDSDETSSRDKTVTTSSSTVIKRQTQIDISRALTVDPNVFEYDSIYDSMKSNKESKNGKSSEHKEKKPKYINNLLKYSQNRKKEQERRVERKIQKERESEADLFEDKESFVTNAYKEKLEEMRIEDENDRRQQAIDELLDVTKQKDLSGFYRNLLNNNISSELKSTETNSSQTAKQVLKTQPKPKPIRQIRRRRSSSEESSNDDNTNVGTEPNICHTIPDEIEKCDKLSEKMESRVDDNHKDNAFVIRKKEDKENKEENKEQSKEENKSKHSTESNLVMNETEEEIVETINKTPKLDKREILIKKFTKRTIDEIYESAKLRYFERKANY